MSSIYFSARLCKLVGSDKITPDQNSHEKSPNDWNAHLFPIYGRKCIIATNKGTLYSFVRLDIFKKDLQDLAAFFVNSLFKQLKADGLFQSKIFYEWLDSFSDLQFRRTDNDKAVIGSMNDIIYQLKVAIEFRVPSLTNLTDLSAGTYVNKLIHGSLHYKTPLERIATKKNNA